MYALYAVTITVTAVCLAAVRTNAFPTSGFADAEVALHAMIGGWVPARICAIRLNAMSEALFAVFPGGHVVWSTTITLPVAALRPATKAAFVRAVAGKKCGMLFTFATPISTPLIVGAPAVSPAIMAS